MVPRARKNTTLDPSGNPLEGLGEASPDLLSLTGGLRLSIVGGWGRLREELVFWLGKLLPKAVICKK